MFESLNNWSKAGVLLLGLGSVAGCSSYTSPYVPDRRGPEAVKEVKPDSGIYQFPANQWPASLADFRFEHPELRIVDTEIATCDGHGDPTSFVVVTERAK